MRRLSYLLLAACLCLPLVGCGGEAEKPAPETPATDDAGSGTTEEGSGSTEGEEAPAE